MIEFIKTQKILINSKFLNKLILGLILQLAHPYTKKPIQQRASAVLKVLLLLELEQLVMEHLFMEQLQNVVKQTTAIMAKIKKPH